MLARPAHTLTAVVTLAIGIGANVAMFAVVDGVLLAPLDYRDADHLVVGGGDEAGPRTRSTWATCRSSI